MLVITNFKRDFEAAYGTGKNTVNNVGDFSSKVEV